MECGVTLSGDLVGGRGTQAKRCLVVQKAAERAWERKGQTGQELWTEIR